MIPYGRQDISEADVQAVVDVLRSDFLTQGPVVPAFEQAVAMLCGVPHAIAANSATSALHVACLALDVGPGDVVWTSPITFVASANCALYCGARIDFVDIDPRTYNMSVSSLEEKLAAAKRSGSLPKVVIPVHLAGQPCDMRAIHALAQEYGFRIIEDASHAIGGSYLGERIGNCRFSDATVFSFHPVKIITTAEGGMITTADERIAKKMRCLRTHGITREPEEMTLHDQGAFYYEQVALGLNYRMTDVQGALGLSQLRCLDEFLYRRREIAQRYDSLLADMPLVRPFQHTDGASAWHLYIVRLNLATMGRSRRQVFDAMRARSIGVNVHYIPVYRQPYYQQMGFDAASWPEAERYYAEALTLPVYSRLTPALQNKVVAALTASISGALE